MGLRVSLPGIQAPAEIKLEAVVDERVVIEVTDEDGRTVRAAFDRFEMEEWLRVAGSGLREF